MKWGIRRYQNPDGSLTAAGKRRQEKYAGLSNKEYKKEYRKAFEANEQKSKYNKELSKLDKKSRELAEQFDIDLYSDDPESKSRIDRLAGQKYKRMRDEMELLRAQRRIDAGEKTANQLEKKYGNQVYSNLENRKELYDSLTGLGLTLAFTLPMGYIVGKNATIPSGQ